MIYTIKWFSFLSMKEEGGSTYPEARDALVNMAVEAVESIVKVDVSKVEFRTAIILSNYSYKYD